METPTIEVVLEAFEQNGKEIFAELDDVQDPEMIETKNRTVMGEVGTKSEFPVADDLMTAFAEIQAEGFRQTNSEISYLSVELWCSDVAHFLLEICEKEFSYSPKASSRSLFRMFDSVLKWEEPKDDMGNALRVLARIRKLDLVFVFSLDWKPEKKVRRARRKLTE